jgi:hypothetical protein
MGCAIGCGEGRGIQAPARSRLARRACDDLRLQHPKRQHFFREPIPRERSLSGQLEHTESSLQCPLHVDSSRPVSANSGH